MNIGNITSDNFNLDSNGKDIQIEVYEQLIEQLQQEDRKQKEIIDETINAIDLVIELIKQQPAKDNRWILDRLNGFKIILENKGVSEWIKKIY